MTLPYHMHKQMTSTSGIQQFFSIRMGDIYDPEYAVGGHQPLGHDQWAQYYKHWQVVSSTISVTFRPYTAANSRVVKCAVICDDDVTLPTDLNTKMERYPGCFKTIKNDTSSTCTIKGAYNAKKWFHKRDLDDNSWKSDFGFLATNQAYYHVLVQTLDESTTSSPLQVDVKVSYRVKLTDPVEITGS